MRQLHNTVVLTGNTRTGKSTALRQFLSPKSSSHGFLSIDQAGKRMLFFLDSSTFVAFESEAEHGFETESIGKFHFLKSTFERAKEYLRNSFTPKPHWWVVDEIGPLELYGKGFEPDFGQALTKIEQQSQACFFVVVREKLIDAFKQQYGIPSCILTKSTLQTMDETVGVVLCGGKSERMGTPKALLCYHNDMPQFQWVGNLLANIVNTIVITNGQLDLQNYSGWTYIPDVAENQGPAAGVLAAFKANPNNHLLVCGCDYPLIRIADLVKLVAESEPAMAVCYKDQSSASLDPLVCFYHKSCLPIMEEWYSRGNRSLRHFLQTIPHQVLTPLDVQRMTSVDDTSAFHKIKSRLHGDH